MSSTAFYDTYGSMFWIAVGGIVTGVCIAGFKDCYKCKCSEIGLCYGLVTINRDTEHETVIDGKHSRAELGIAGINGSGSDDIPSPSQRRKFRFSFGSGGSRYFPATSHLRKDSSPPLPI